VGTFDLDDILNDLDEVVPGKGASADGEARTTGDDEASATDAAPSGTDEADGSASGDDTGSAESGESTERSSRGFGRLASGSMFRRTSPDEIPRPPDLNGGGLGAEAGTARVGADVDPVRPKPDDGLTELNVDELPARDQSPAEADPFDLEVQLEARGVVTAEQLDNARRVAKQSPGRRIEEIVLEMDVDAARVQEVVAATMQMAFERLTVPEGGQEPEHDVKAFKRLTPDYCKERQLLPLRRDGKSLVVAVVRPDCVFVLDDVKRRLGMTAVLPVIVPAHDLAAVIERLTQAEAEEEFDVDDLLADVDEDDVEVVKQQEEDDGTDEADSHPVIRYVNHIIQTAMKEGASDIHIEPDEKTLKVRFRIDGVLFEMMNPPRKMHAALTSRIKIMANLDIAERRLPQDGRIRVTVLGRKLDLRVSTVPTPKGEKTVMRILDNRSIQVTLDELGFSEDTLTIWKHQIAQPHGIILVTGPTGSGKTTTLYSSIRQMDLKKLNVSTVEDPVEYNLSNITQIQTHERIGMNFAKALKALLRQDPDVIMVGEIRDMETATTAIQAAMTGHLVLSTLHTNDAPSSLTRLINIGVEPFLVGAAVNAVLAQRLIRRICKHCGHDEAPKEEILEYLRMHGISTDTVRGGAGCDRCRQTGYSGRAGLYELLVLDDTLRDNVSRSPSVTEFRRVCAERGMVSLREDGFQKVARGVTTVEEILRVTESTI